MIEGDIVLTSVAQADGHIKRRPALLLRVLPPFGDFLICGISTQLHQQVIGFDEVISITDADFSTSGLKSSSLVRLGFLSILPRNQSLGAIGLISPERHKRLLQNLADHLLK